MDQQPHQPAYQVVQPNDDYKQSVIEKKYLKTATFTLAEVEKHQATLAKVKKELEGQITVDKAMMQNVIDYHAAVGALSDEDLAGAAIYYEAKRRITENTSSLETVSKQIADYETEVPQIMKAVGFQPAVDPTITSDKPSDDVQTSTGTQGE
jgi:HAMP domain-containing protein